MWVAGPFSHFSNPPDTTHKRDTAGMWLKTAENV